MNNIKRILTILFLLTPVLGYSQTLPKIKLLNVEKVTVDTISDGTNKMTLLWLKEGVDSVSILNNKVSILEDSTNSFNNRITSLESGSGTDDQVASEVPITDAGGYYSGNDVEAMGQEIGASLATKLESNETITLSGDITGSGTTSITTTVGDDSHNHIISNIDNLQDSLNLFAEINDIPDSSWSEITVNDTIMFNILKTLGTISDTFALTIYPDGIVHYDSLVPVASWMFDQKLDNIFKEHNNVLKYGELPLMYKDNNGDLHVPYRLQKPYTIADIQILGEVEKLEMRLLRNNRVIIIQSILLILILLLIIDKIYKKPKNG